MLHLPRQRMNPCNCRLSQEIMNQLSKNPTGQSGPVITRFVMVCGISWQHVGDYHHSIAAQQMIWRGIKELWYHLGYRGDQQQQAQQDHREATTITRQRQKK
jgi:hypothetical protein